MREISSLLKEVMPRPKIEAVFKLSFVQFLFLKLSEISLVTYVYFSIPLIIFTQYILPPFFVAKISEFSDADFIVLGLSILCLIPWGAIYFFNELFIIKHKFKVVVTSRAVNFFHLLAWSLVLFSIGVLWFLSGSLPLLEALIGADAGAIYESRINFDLNKSSYFLLPVYLFIFSSTYLLPLSVLIHFIDQRKNKWIVLVFAFVLVSVGFSKLAFIKIALPVMFYFLVHKRLACFFRAVMVSVIFFSSICLLYLGVIGKTLNGNVNDLFSGSSINSTETSSRLDENYILGSSGVNQLLGRALWIPYITAKKWIDFYEKENLYLTQPIITNRTIAWLVGAEYVQLERKVFNYQFGLKDSEMQGYANTSYFVDAWVKFGKFGFGIICFLVPTTLIFFIKNFHINYLGIILFMIPFLVGGGSYISLLISGSILFVFFMFMQIERKFVT